MTALSARSNAEAHVYAQLHPCGCGATGFGPASTTVVPADDRVTLVLAGPCPGCGTRREFTFHLPAEEPFPDPDQPSFGTSGPSSLIDPGQWLWLADLVPASLPADPATLTEEQRRQARFDLRTAAAAVGEALLFIPAGGEAVPAGALFSEHGRRVYAGDPGRLRRQRLMAAREALLRLAASY